MNSAKPEMARAPARDEPPRPPTSAISAGMVVAIPATNTTLVSTGAHSAPTEMACPMSPTAAIEYQATATRVGP